MSWERYDWDGFSSCACGQGRVVKHGYTEDDDWNRSRSGATGYDIQCPECRKKFRVGCLTRNYPCAPWEGDGIVTKEYLIPKDTILPKVISPTFIQTYTADADIASKYTKDELQAVVEDMKNSKYSTRVQLSNSKGVISICKYRLKTQALDKIIILLLEIIDKYDTYKWNPKTVTEFKQQEQQKIAENKKEIQEVISNSYLLNFKRC